MQELSGRVQSQAVYVSQAVTEFDAQRIEMLADLAAIKNSLLGVTGYLFFAKGRFIQCLEGERAVVSKLLGQIERDNRHEILATAWQHNEQQRQFPNWSMRWIREAEIMDIGLEQILADQVLLNARVDLATLGLDQSIWRMVNTVANSIHSKSNAG